MTTNNRITLLVLAFWSVFVLVMLNDVYNAEAQSSGSRTVLRDSSNQVMGYIDGGSGKVAVKDKNNKLLGYIDRNGTWSKSNSKIANSRLPGLLFCGR